MKQFESTFIEIRRLLLVLETVKLNFFDIVKEYCRIAF